MTTAAIAIGTNLGDREAHIAHARAALARLPRTTLVAFSSVHDTEPVGPVPQGRYLNAAAIVDTELSARELLDELQRIEHEAGRVRGERWGPRTLDLDLLLFGDAVIDEPGLHVPHPRMHERTFVLGPLAEIAPEIFHPVLGRSVEKIFSDLNPAK